MSSILKALRRVEDEVAERAARDLREEVLAPARSIGAESSVGRRGLRVAGLVVGVVALLALGVVLGRRLVPPPSASTPESVARTDAPPASPAPAAPSAPPLPSVPSSPAPAPTAPVVAVVAPPLPPPPSAFVDIEDEPLGAAGAAPAPAPAADSARESFREAPMPAPAASFRPAPAKVVAAPARRPEPRPTPRAAVRPPSASASAPRVASTVWHPDSDRRRAVVEVAGASREVREGETVGAYLVLAIGPTGVVFRRDGNDVTRRVGQR